MQDRRLPNNLFYLSRKLIGCSFCTSGCLATRVRLLFCELCLVAFGNDAVWSSLFSSAALA
ncbi:hypothetical protein KSS87_007285 [Heliosperma pusillum]|nr:hypothetical protein KSS87_007285 [Heliosperma pusillum]